MKQSVSHFKRTGTMATFEHKVLRAHDRVYFTPFLIESFLRGRNGYGMNEETLYL